MGNAAIRQRSTTREVGNALHVRLAHDARVVDGNVHVQLVQLDVLLGKGVDQVGVRHAGQRQHRHLVELGVIQSVQQVDSAGTGGRQTDAQATGEFGVAAGHEGGRLLVPHLHEADAVLAIAQGFHDAVDTVAGQAEDRVDTPIMDGVDQHVGSSLCHAPHPARGMPARQGVTPAGVGSSQPSGGRRRSASAGPQVPGS